MGPVGPVAPVAPVGPVAPIGPVAPVAPIGPVSPLAPVGPVAPVAPVAPVGPVIPFAPVGPVGPVGPVAEPIAPVGLKSDRWGRSGPLCRYCSSSGIRCYSRMRRSRRCSCCLYSCLDKASHSILPVSKNISVHTPIPYYAPIRHRVTAFAIISSKTPNTTHSAALTDCLVYRPQRAH